MPAKKEYNESNTLVPLYDNEDAVCGIVYNGTPYYFLKNLQGDIIAIADANGTTVARYTYDAWGKVTAITGANQTIAEINSFRYRGYYYDAEIGMYYLQSRYYDPMVGRFVNGDDALVGVVAVYKNFINNFSYCCNNCICRSDHLGFVSYSNTMAFINQKTGWVINTTIKGTETLYFRYYIKAGMVKFDFEKDGKRNGIAYDMACVLGYPKKLAEAIYTAAKKISKNYLKGRSIKGIYTELSIHWMLYIMRIKTSSTKCTDMGGTSGIGYDSNAWVFEFLSSILNINSSAVFLRKNKSTVKGLARYF